MNDSFISLINQQNIPSLNIIDIGASGGMDTRWKNFKTCGILVEPDPREIENLKKNLPANYHLITKALSSEKVTKTFYLYRKQACSSFYRPNLSFVRQFPESERLEVVSEVQLETDTLDNQMQTLHFSETLDILKVDVEGHELAILEGASEVLTNLIAVELEVNFSEIRLHAPLFSEVDTFLRGKGFILVDLRRTFWLRKNVASDYATKGQIILGDALYFLPTVMVVQKFKNDPLKCFRAFLAYLSYGYKDLALELLEMCKIEIWNAEQVEVATNLYTAFVKGKRKLPPKILRVIKEFAAHANSKWGYLDWFAGDSKLGNDFYK